MKVIASIALACWSLGEAHKVALQHKEIYKYGVFATIGTPENEFFLGADFSLTTTRIYSEDMRAIFFGPLPDSSSRVRLSRREGGGWGDMMSIGGEPLGNIPIQLLGNGTPEDIQDRKMSADSEGRLALSPGSRISKTRIIQVSKDLLQFPGAPVPRLGESMDFLTAPPALPEGSQDLSVRIVGRDDGWFVRAKVKLNNRDGTTETVQVAMDPTTEGIEVPKAAMSRLAVIMRLANSDVVVSGQGRLMLPCTAEGVYEAVPDMVLQLDDGRTLRVVHPTTAPLHWIKMEGGRLMCPSLIGVDMTSSNPVMRPDGTPDMEGGYFRIDPMMIENVNSVLFDGKRNTITFRSAVDAAPMDVVETRNSPRVAMFNSFAMLPPTAVTNGNAMLILPADDGVYPGAVKHTLHNSKAIKKSDGTLFFAFNRFSSAIGDGPSIRELPGVFELVSDTLSFDREGRALTLELKPVVHEGPRPSKRGTKRYTVSVERNEVLMMILLKPVGAPKDTEAVSISQSIGKLAADYRAMGKDVTM